MDEQKVLAQQFEVNRAHLHRVAYRMLGSNIEAEDAVQEAWLRLSRADTTEVENLGGWLTTVVARVCLDALRARKTRREDAFDANTPEPQAKHAADEERELADNIGFAMLVVLETLTPSERIAFVLHDMFDLPFDDIAPIVNRTPTAARQLASRARRRVQGARAAAADPDRARRREIVEAFLAASRGGDFAALMALLDPNAVLHCDAFAVQMSQARVAAGAPVLQPEMQGARAVADTFKGRAAAARLVLIDDEFGAVFAPGGKPLTAFAFTIVGGKITALSLIADPQRLGALTITPAG